MAAFQNDTFQNDAFDAGASGPIGHSENGSLSFTSSMVRRTSRALAGALSFSSAISRRTGRALAGSLGFVSAMTRRTSRSSAASLSFSGSLSPALVVPSVPALVAIHIHTE